MDGGGEWEEVGGWSEENGKYGGKWARGVWKTHVDGVEKEWMKEGNVRRWLDGARGSGSMGGGNGMSVGETMKGKHRWNKGGNDCWRGRGT